MVVLLIFQTINVGRSYGAVNLGTSQAPETVVEVTVGIRRVRCSVLEEVNTTAAYQRSVSDGGLHGSVAEHGDSSIAAEGSVLGITGSGTLSLGVVGGHPGIVDGDALIVTQTHELSSSNVALILGRSPVVGRTGNTSLPRVDGRLETSVLVGGSRESRVVDGACAGVVAEYIELSSTVHGRIGERIEIYVNLRSCRKQSGSGNSSTQRNHTLAYGALAGELINVLSVVGSGSSIYVGFGNFVVDGLTNLGRSHQETGGVVAVNSFLGAVVNDFDSTGCSAISFCVHIDVVDVGTNRTMVQHQSEVYRTGYCLESLHAIFVGSLLPEVCACSSSSLVGHFNGPAVRFKAREQVNRVHAVFSVTAHVVTLCIGESTRGGFQRDGETGICIAVSGFATIVLYIIVAGAGGEAQGQQTHQKQFVGFHNLLFLVN